MLQFFRTNQLLNSLMLFPYALVLNHGLFFGHTGTVPTEADGILSPWLHTFWNDFPISSAMFYVFLLFMQAILVNRISIVFRIGNEINLFPGLIYLIFVSFFPQFQQLTGLMMGQLFFLFAFTALLQTYKRYMDKGMLFNSAFWIGMASLFYAPFLMGILVIVIGAFILKPIKGKDWLLILNGMVVPYFFIFTIWYAIGYEPMDILHEFKVYLQFDIPFLPIEVSSFIPLLILTSVILIALVNYQFYHSKKSLRSKKNIDIIYWTLFLFGISTLIFQGIELQHIVLVAVPLSLLLQDSLVRIENPLTSEIIHLFMLGALFFFQYQTFL